MDEVDGATVEGASRTGSAAADRLAEDALVFARRAGGFRLIGGAGRGEGWADIVDLEPGAEPLIDRAWRTGLPVRSDAAEPIHVAGPYWSRHSVIVPLGHEHLVVFGSRTPITASDAAVVRAAAGTVAETGGASAEKLLGDELELVHAIRALMAYRAETVRDTARHIALIAARSLSCDVGAVQVATGGAEALEVIYLQEAGVSDGTAGPDAAAYLRAATALEDLRVEQTVGGDPRLWDADVVSRLTVPIGAGSPLGAFVLGHSVDRPRGFTMLCQRIARALAEAAELLLAQAITREALAAERVVLDRITRTDPLTGLANRTGWEQALASLQAGDGGEAPTYAILSADLDELKVVNDRYGHPIGDAVLRGAANLLRTATRAGDTVARVGGDEFLVLLPSIDADGAARIARRIRRHVREWRVTEFALTPKLSIGWSVSTGDGSAATIVRADRRMYALKRRRAHASGTPIPRRSANARIDRGNVA